MHVKQICYTLLSWYNSQIFFYYTVNQATFVSLSLYHFITSNLVLNKLYNIKSAHM